MEVTVADVRVIGRARLRADLARLDLTGRSVLVHCSMRLVGPVSGGAAMVLSALRSVCGASATVVVPTQTANNSSTSDAFLSATRDLTPEEVVAFEARMAGHDPAVTPSYRMGALAEHVRTRPGAIRSSHPQASFAGLGPSAAAWMAVHDLECHLGERSPLAALYRDDAWVLLLGVDWGVCTALHLAEYHLPWPPPPQRYRCYVQVDGERQRLDFDGVRYDTSDFLRIGAELDVQSFVRSGAVGNGSARAFPIREAVDFAIRWMTDHRR